MGVPFPFFDTCTADVTALLQGPDPIFEKLHGQDTKTLVRPAKVIQSHVNIILILKIHQHVYHRRITSKIMYVKLLRPSPSFAPSLCFLTLLVCQTVSRLIRGNVGSRTELVGVPPWSDLPLNRILYIPFNIFAYSSNIFIANLDLMDSMLAWGTLKNSKFFFSSSSLSDRAPAMKLTCSTIHPGCDIVLLSADLKEAYCASATHLVLTTYRLVTLQGLELPSLVRDIVWTLKRTFKDRFDPKKGGRKRML